MHESRRIIPIMHIHRHYSVLNNDELNEFLFIMLLLLLQLSRAIITRVIVYRTCCNPHRKLAFYDGSCHKSRGIPSIWEDDAVVVVVAAAYGEIRMSRLYNLCVFRAF